MRRKEPLVNDETYHIFIRSIADFRIFNNQREFERLLKLLKYYQIENNLKFSKFIDLDLVQNIGFDRAFETVSKNKERSVQIIAYCIMPTHIHLIIKQLDDNGISNFMRKVLNGYTSYFNLKHKRKGPLWESKFKNVLIRNDDQLLHLTRYLHLNPATAHLIDHPKDWVYSSYKEYLSLEQNREPLCQFSNVLDINPKSYHRFVEDRIAYQRELANIKKLLLEDL